MRIRKRAALAAATAVICGAGVLGARPVQAAPAERATPSGLPVPRYVSLKFGRVNARAGPGDDHRLLWVYEVRGLPLQIVAETAEWRRVCDPDGGLAWVHKRVTDGRRMTMNVGALPAPLRAKPKDVARVEAYLKPRALAALVRCQDGWCKVRADDTSGWVRTGELWGASEAVQCRRAGAVATTKGR